MKSVLPTVFADLASQAIVARVFQKVDVSAFCRVSLDIVLEIFPVFLKVNIIILAKSSLKRI